MTATIFLPIFATIAVVGLLGIFIKDSSPRVSRDLGFLALGGTIVLGVMTVIMGVP